MTKIRRKTIIIRGDDDNSDILKMTYDSKPMVTDVSVAYSRCKE